MIDFTNPDINYWFKPEFARPIEIPEIVYIKYYIVNDKRKRHRVWKLQGHTFRERDGIIWRTIKIFNADNITEAVKTILEPKIKDLFERDSPFYEQISRRK